jgi:hypothetical protein
MLFTDLMARDTCMWITGGHQELNYKAAHGLRNVGCWLTAMLCKHDTLVLLCRVSRDVILWRKPAEKEGVSHCSFALHTSATAQISITNGAIEGCDKTLTLVPYEDSEASSEVQDAFKRFPYLGGCTAFKLEDGIGSEVIAELVQTQLCVSTSDDGAISSATGVQIAGLLDSEYVFFFHSCSCNHVAM